MAGAGTEGWDGLRAVPRIPPVAAAGVIQGVGVGVAAPGAEAGEGLEVAVPGVEAGEELGFAFVCFDL